VTLLCRTPAGQKQWRVAVPVLGNDGGVIATMWARRTIQSLEEVNNLHRNRYGVAPNSREARTVVSISKEFGLLSSLTTFIAIEHRSLEERNEGRPALRRVPVMLAEGWASSEAPAGGLMHAILACPAPRAGIADKTLDRSVDRSIDRSIATAAESAAGIRGRERRRFGFSQKKSSFSTARSSMAGGSAGSAPAAAPEPSGLHQVLATQGANGAFEPTQVVWDLLRADGRNTAHWPQAIERSAPVVEGGLLDRDAVVRTVVALLLLRSHFADRQSLWRRAAAKAVTFLGQAFGLAPLKVESWLKDMEARLLTPRP
jgi:hypothetical protein